MFSLWKKLGIRYKILFNGLLLVAVFSSTIIFYFVPEFRKNVIERKKEKIRDLVNFASIVIDNYYNEAEMGTLDSEAAKARALYEIAKFTFGDENERDRFQVFTYKCKLLVDRDRTELIGKNLADYKDISGRRIFMEMAQIAEGKSDIAKGKHEGFLYHEDQYKDRLNSSVSRVSYVKAYEPWGWFISAGVYINDIEKEIVSVYIKVIIVTALLIITAVFLLFLTSEAVTRPITELTKSMAGLDLSSVLKTKMKDETGLMARYFNSFIITIRDLVQEIKQSSSQLAVSANEMSTVSMNFTRSAHDQNESTMMISTTIKNITEEMDQVSSEIDSEFESLNMLVENMEELSEMINIVESDTSEARTTIAAINIQAEKGDEAMKKMSDIMDKSRSSSKEMTGIIRLINDISEQINLLSLNAAIEAARAGDRGRGFAVVADQISNLADETSQSINAVSKLIMENEEQINIGYDHTKKTIKNISTIIQGVSELDLMICGISDKMKRQVGTKEYVSTVINDIKEKSDGIRMATKVQKVAIAEINDYIRKIASGNQQIADGSEELLSSTEEVADMTELLKQKVSVFRLSG